MMPGFARERRVHAPWTITASIGGFKDVQIGWNGESEADVILSWLTFLEDEPAVIAVTPEEVPYPGFRQLHVIFEGSRKTIVFRPDWVAGATFERS